MKKTTRFLSILLAVALLVSSLAACGKGKEEETLVDEIQQKDYEEQSSTLYQSVLGEYYDVYSEAIKEQNVSARFAKMAIAEAKLLETGVMLPTSSQGGTYQMSRVAPHTNSSVLWGHDMYRYHNRVVATDFITKEDRDALNAIYAQKVGTGEYEQAAKDYLTEKGYTLTDELAIAYNTDPKTWDILNTYLATDAEAIVNTFDGLLEYDMENVQQPALAESYEVSEDGLTYTFKIKSGLVWVDSQGREVAQVKADDFVAGMQHLMDAKGGLESILTPVIAGAADYISGNTTDFATVGVKAPDDTTLVYTLVEPAPFFVTMLGYSPFAPMSRSYYETQGGKFGEAYDNSAEDYKYGTDPDHIAYCGPYLVTSNTAENSIVFKANPKYWNAANVNVKTITWLFNDGSDATKAYKDALAGTLTACTVNTSVIELAKSDGNFDKYVYTTATDATAYSCFMNVNRQAYANAADETVLVSGLSDQDKVRSNFAMRNVHFRRALCFGVERASYNAQTVGEDLKMVSVTNSYTPGNFVKLSEDVTVSINGTDKTFKAGTYYGEIVQAQMDADEFPVKVWDPKGGSDGLGSSAGFDGWYNVDNAKAELDKAIEELAKDGVVIDEDHPIHLELPYPSNSELYTNKAMALKKSIDATFEGKVIIDLAESVDFAGWLYAGYYTESGKEANYHLYDLSGWIPDFGDPSSYLNTFLPDYNGDMIKCIGIY